MQKKTFLPHQAEWEHAAGMLGLYLLGCAVNWVLANLNVLPVSPVTSGILAVVLRLAKQALDGK